MRLDQIPLLGRFMVPENGGPARTKSTESQKQLLELGSLAPEAALAKLGVNDRGLDAPQVEERRAKFGANDAGHEKHLGVVAEIFERIKNPLVIQLLVIAGVSYLMGDLRAASVVGGMIVLSVSLAYFQEKRSNKAAEKLQALIKTTCAVLRSGQEVEVPMRDLVPGDIVVLVAGSIIPADLRLLVSKDLYTSQSALTGEAMPVEKHA
jgi:Mg2+-importing ATPase